MALYTRCLEYMKHFGNINIVCGNNGKDLATKFLSEQYQNYDTIILASPTENKQSYFSKWIKPENVLDKWSEDWASEFWDAQHDRNNHKPLHEHHKVLLIFDYCCKEVEHSEVLETMALRCRTYSISMLHLTHSLKEINPQILNMACFVYCGKTNKTNRRLIYDNFIASFTFEQFDELYKLKTSNEGYLCIGCEWPDYGDLCKM